MSNKEKFLASAQKNLQKGQVSKAINDYQKVVLADPKDMRNRQKLAELLSRERRIDEAQTEYEAVAKYYTENGFYLKAIAVYKQMQKLEPTRANIYHRLAELNEKQGLVGNALAEYRTLVSYYEKNRMFPEAVNVLQKMRDLEPENLNIRVKVAEGYAQSGNMAQARRDFDDILNDLKAKEDHPRILKLYEILIPLFPKDSGMKTGMAKALIEGNEADKGITLLRSLMKDDPENPQVLAFLAQGYRKKGDFENERLTYHHLLKSAPDDLDLREFYVGACLDGGEYRRALEELEEWKKAFFDGGRARTLKVFYERLKPLVDDRQVMLTLQSVYEATGEGDKLFEVMSSIPGKEGGGPEPVGEALSGAVLEAVIPDAAVEDLEELEEIADLEPAELEDEECLEEFSLEFLEEVEGLTGAPPSQTALDEGIDLELSLELIDEEPGEADEEELEIELEDEAPDAESAVDEIDLELELDIPEPEIETPLEEEESVLELQLDEIVEFDSDNVVDEAEEVSLEIELVSEPPISLTTEDDDFLVLDIQETSAAGELQIDLRAELEEAEFYLQQGLFDDAERVCRGLLASQADLPEVQAKLEEIAARRDETSLEEESSFDLAGEMPSENRGGLMDDSEEETDRFGLDGVIGEFKKGVESQIDADDAESHYNLGIAYKEMGLLDDAVNEFDNAMRNPLRMLDCLTLKGICLIEKGDFEGAEDVFRSAMSRSELSDVDRMGLSFEMGLLYEAWSRPDQSLAQFQAVAEADRSFRDVGEKILALQKVIENEEAKGKRDRVSFV
ncbi:tetratricopeptide repeat protein [Desulfuromonas soudanensis]|uniref:tetratricopeptide repeat protein n=1 Tax=Desulfuromonas soudanensis TaxID=1603606 RepID=UPI0006AD10D2|nr:tetratricopeptide repeat protein [Desulfuromonas soudanensis]